MTPLPQCFLCKHYHAPETSPPGCTAFKLIPLEILSNKTDHHKPYPGDRGIRFEPKPTS